MPIQSLATLTLPNIELPHSEAVMLLGKHPTGMTDATVPGELTLLCRKLFCERAVIMYIVSCCLLALEGRITTAGSLAAVSNTAPAPGPEHECQIRSHRPYTCLSRRVVHKSRPVSLLLRYVYSIHPTDCHMRYGITCVRAFDLPARSARVTAPPIRA